MTYKIKVGVLASGGGTDLQSIIDASEKNMIDAEVKVVISDRCDAFCLKRAEKHNIQTYFIDPKNKSRTQIDSEIDRILLEKNIDLVVGAGYMRILSKDFVKKWYKNHDKWYIPFDRADIIQAGIYFLEKFKQEYFTLTFPPKSFKFQSLKK